MMKAVTNQLKKIQQEKKRLTKTTFQYRKPLLKVKI